MSNELLQGEVRALNKRKINEETCRKWGYQVGEYKGKTVQIAPYYDPDGNMVAQKIRFPNKDFRVLGDLKQATLFGQHLWRDQGKMVVVTEGEIDALSVSQVQQNKWPVVSVPNGAQGAKKSIAKALDWLLGFDHVIFMFDDDEPGRIAAKQCADILPPGRAKIARIDGFKDANEALQAGQPGKIIDAIWGAKVHRPDGILAGHELWDEVIREDSAQSCPYPWVGLNEKLRGIRMGELVTITAGSGVGKSAVVRELAYHLLREGETVGLLMLEENVRRTALGFMGLAINKPLHIDREGVTEDQMKDAFAQTLGTGRVYLYDHFGSTEIENLLSRIRYMAKACECGWIILDHLSIVVSGLGDGDERRLIDNAMTMLRTLTEETGIGLIVVSHLKRPEGKGHEEGAQVSLAQLRGSAAIAQLSDIVIGLERNQQAEGQERDLTHLRVLKNRFSGDTGPACYLLYSHETGRLSEVSPEFLEDRERVEEDDEDDCPF